MANEEHLEVLSQGVATWNEWRKKNPEESIELSGANLTKVNLSGANLSGSNLSRASLVEANLSGADLSRAKLIEAFLYGTNLEGANLNRADLRWASDSLANFIEVYLGEPNLLEAGRIEAFLYAANLKGANLNEANLNGVILRGACLCEVNLRKANLSEAHLVLANFSRAKLCEANLYEANLRETCFCNAKLMGARLDMTNLYKADLTATNLMGADLCGANLRQAVLCKADLSGSHLIFASLINTNLEGATITGCHIYGISTWDLMLKGTIQKDLIITPLGEPAITIDNIEVAQFIYLLLHNEKIRRVIETITSKVVLILGRFTQERKPVLDAIKEELRKNDYLPVLFDFDRPSTRNTLETITLLARLSRFIIADITDPLSVPQELISIVSVLPSVPVKPILQAGHGPWGMYDAIKCYPWVLEIYYYPDLGELLTSIKEKVIDPAEAKAKRA